MKSILFALLAMLCWGIAPVFSKVGLVKMDPFMALTIRSVSTAVVMLLAGLFTGKLIIRNKGKITSTSKDLLHI